jgi:hypothetical protein
VKKKRQESIQGAWKMPLAVMAAASIAGAGLLAFTGEGTDPGRTRTEARGVVPSSTDDDISSGIVRARGGGIAETTDGPSATAGGSPTNGPTSGPKTPGPNSPTPEAPGDIRKAIADEMRERFGGFATTPEGEEAAEQAAELVEGGSSVDDAISEIVGPPDPDRTSNPIIPFP